ncbi:hypothetical protein KEM56_005664 [Ascosphaera pollenicola]|nr:hypothetical protein KEM56_005664 [Ascosphaera pollenicola]
MSYSIPAIAIPGQRLGSAATYSSGPGTHLHESYVCASIAGPVILEESEVIQSSATGTAKIHPKKKQTLIVGRGTNSTAPIQPGVNGPAIVKKTIPATTTTTTTTTSTGAAAGVGADVDTTSTARKSARERAKYNTLPAVDSIVLGRITRVQRRQAALTILVVLDDADAARQATDSPAAIASILSAAAPATATADNNNVDDLRFSATIRREDVRAVEKDKIVMEEMFRVGDIVRASVISLGDQSSYYCSTARNEFGVVMARSEEGNMMFPVSWREMRDAVTGRSELRKVAKPY